MSKCYIGGSLYVEFDGYMLTLTTENGGEPSNTIALEPEVYFALTRYVDSLRESEKAGDAEGG